MDSFTLFCEDKEEPPASSSTELKKPGVPEAVRKFCAGPELDRVVLKPSWSESNTFNSPWANCKGPGFSWEGVLDHPWHIAKVLYSPECLMKVS